MPPTSNSSATFLGIDLGTTTVKLCILSAEKEVLQEFSAPHNSTIPHEKLPDPKWHEQCVKGIVKCTRALLSQFSPDLLASLVSIAVTGQMHGLVLWDSSSITNDPEEWNISHLVTWMDERFDASYLRQLPKWKWEGAYRGPLTPLANGFGCATLAWLQSQRALDSKWDRAGNVTDFFTTLLTNSPQVVMSTQHASAWGYAIGEEWCLTEELRRVIPTRLLPKIVKTGSVMGETNARYLLDFFPGIRAGVQVLAALGDMQCSLLPILAEKMAVIQLSTSSQIGFIVDTAGLSESELAAKFECIPRLSGGAAIVVPFFHSHVLVVVASTNGGNCLEAFVKQVARWAHSLFGLSAEQSRLRSGLYEQLFNDAASSRNDKLDFRPIFFAERHAPAEMNGAEVRGWKADASVEEFLRAISRGLIRNNAELMPEALMCQFGVEELHLTNRAASALFCDEAKRCFPNLKVVLDHGSLSAAYGATLIAIEVASGGASGGAR